MTKQHSLKVLSAVLLLFVLGCNGCDEDEFFPGVWDSNIIWRCMNDENLPVATVNERLIGTWAEGHISNTLLPDSLGPFIDTLVFQENNQVLVSYQFGHEIQTAYELFIIGDPPAEDESVNYRIRFEEEILTLPRNDIYFCEDRLFFNASFINRNPDNFEYGFDRVAE